MLVETTNSGLVLYNHANFYRFEEASSYWSIKQISVFSLLGFTGGIGLHDFSCILHIMIFEAV